MELRNRIWDLSMTLANNTSSKQDRVIRLDKIQEDENISHRSAFTMSITLLYSQANCVFTIDIQGGVGFLSQHTSDICSLSHHDQVVPLEVWDSVAPQKWKLHYVVISLELLQIDNIQQLLGSAIKQNLVLNIIFSVDCSWIAILIMSLVEKL